MRTGAPVLDRLRRRAKRNKWGQKLLVILMTLMMLTVGMTYIIQAVTGA